MKTLLFGNPNTDYWKLSLDDISVTEDLVFLKGELSTGFFSAGTPMYVSTSALARFTSEVRQLDHTLVGTAMLENKNQQSEITWKLTALRLGHIESSGRFTINENSLDFRFQTDQTQLGPLAKWLDGLLASFEKKKKAGPTGPANAG